MENATSAAPIADRVFFDACLIHGESHALPDDACGAIVFNAGDAPRTAENRLYAGALTCIVGPNDPRYPNEADVLDLQLADAELIRHLKEPSVHWWPLCGTARAIGTRILLRLNAREFASIAKGATRLARAFSNVRLIVDPFIGGKESTWRAGVCLADEPNIWLTTRGLYAAEDGWPDRAEREALYFTIGEVGAGKLLFASGLTPEKLNAQPIRPSAWLESIDFLDAKQRELILRKNAAELLDLMND